ncbi:uncharacterized protein I303_102077 [Kwoniella dejecticola CBS 10117]|uniref:Uncharacterized protein n=1 Tax=Kwoniella dejecticola CBS 10117 TaxID=1296121 RepID=A0A1A6ABY9_9TREE|nr:uncharacterized protein I303_01782 [Kwoniella dejecticola CBS 10117]OBR87574.1 hypothetical protein I303_01782 [Kwoniella dejecticola CBS 10117]
MSSSDASSELPPPDQRVTELPDDPQPRFTDTSTSSRGAANPYKATVENIEDESETQNPSDGSSGKTGSSADSESYPPRGRASTRAMDDEFEQYKDRSQTPPRQYRPYDQRNQTPFPHGRAPDNRESSSNSTENTMSGANQFSGDESDGWTSNSDGVYTPSSRRKLRGKRKKVTEGSSTPWYLQSIAEPAGQSHSQYIYPPSWQNAPPGFPYSGFPTDPRTGMPSPWNNPIIGTPYSVIPPLGSSYSGPVSTMPYSNGYVPYNQSLPTAADFGGLSAEEAARKVDRMRMAFERAKESVISRLRRMTQVKRAKEAVGPEQAPWLKSSAPGPTNSSVSTALSQLNQLGTSSAWNPSTMNPSVNASFVAPFDRKIPVGNSEITVPAGWTPEQALRHTLASQGLNTPFSQASQNANSNVTAWPRQIRVTNPATGRAGVVTVPAFTSVEDYLNSRSGTLGSFF